MRALTTLLIFVAFTSLHADWRVIENENISTPTAALQHFHVTLEDQSKAQMDVLLFRERDLKFHVVDNPGNELGLDEAMQKQAGDAGVNGGFFHPDGTPLGLLISEGKQIHPLEHARLLSGLVVVTPTRMALLRTAELKSTKGVQEAIQAGPFLVDHGKAVVGLNNQRAAARTVVASDGKGHFALILCRVVTLAEMANLLATPGMIPQMKVERALNLDGGSSSAMWVKGNPDFYSAEGKRVRNFLAIRPR